MVKLVAATLTSVPQSIEDRRLEYLAQEKYEQGLCMDAGHDYDESPGHFPMPPIFGHEAKKARRWVAERTHSWLNRHRHVLIR